MARLDWTAFLATHPKAHLLAGHVPEPSPTVLKRLRRLLQALIDGQAPMGDYATAIVRRRDITEIQCGFADHGDAERVGAWLGSTMVTASGDWLSEQSLQLYERIELALEDMVAGAHGLPDREPCLRRSEAASASRRQVWLAQSHEARGTRAVRKSMSSQTLLFPLSVQNSEGRPPNVNVGLAKTHPIWNCRKSPEFADFRAFRPGDSGYGRGPLHPGREQR